MAVNVHAMVLWIVSRCSPVGGCYWRGLGSFSPVVVLVNHLPRKRSIYPIRLWSWMQNVPSKSWYPSTRLNGVTTQKTTVWTITIIHAGFNDSYISVQDFPRSPSRNSIGQQSRVVLSLYKLYVLYMSTIPLDRPVYILKATGLWLHCSTSGAETKIWQEFCILPSKMGLATSHTTGPGIMKSGFHHTRSHSHHV